MSERAQPEQLVSVEDLAVSKAFEIAALIALLERKGILTRAEVLEEIARQRKGRPRGR